MRSYVCPSCSTLGDFGFSDIARELWLKSDHVFKMENPGNLDRKVCVAVHLWGEKMSMYINLLNLIVTLLC